MMPSSPSKETVETNETKDWPARVCAGVCAHWKGFLLVGMRRSPCSQPQQRPLQLP
uniref:Uncharacterized protein n=1 Tax=Anopheles atroparvus TaxID=41427 RepID=A0AAG5CXH3_ANOAO